MELSAEQAKLYGIRPVEDGGGFFCGVSEEHFAINGVTYRWPVGSKLTWGIGFTRLGALSDMDCKDAITEALKEISGSSNISHEYIANADRANIKIISRRLDGPSGVLADCQIPVGNVSVDQTQLLMRIDDSEAWGLFANPPANKIDFYRVVLHELLHGHGLGHKPANINEAALIAPMYDRNIRNLQAADKAELQRRYGPAKAPATPPTAPPSTPGDRPQAKVQVVIDGVTWEAAGAMRRLG